MKRVALFLVLFGGSTGALIWWAGGIAPPSSPLPREAPEGPVEPSSTPTAPPMVPMEVPHARGLSIGQLQGTGLQIYDEILDATGVRRIHRAGFRFERVDPLSRESVGVEGPTGRFFDDAGAEVVHATSRRGVLRIQEGKSRISIVELHEGVLLRETMEGGLSLATEDLVIEMNQARGRPMLSAPGKVEIRKPGVVLTGEGFRGDTLLNDFVIEKHIRMEIAPDSDLHIPDPLGTSAGRAASGPASERGEPVVLTSPGSIRLRATPSHGSRERTRSPSAGWGIEDLRIRFPRRTTLVRGTRALKSDRLAIDLRWEENPSNRGRGAFAATALDAAGDVRLRDERLHLTCGRLLWDRAAGEGTVRLRHGPVITLTSLGSSPLLSGGPGGPGGPAHPPAASLTIRAGEDVVLRDGEAGQRRVIAGGGVSLLRGDPSTSPAASPPARGLDALQVVLTIQQGNEGSRLDEVDATGRVRVLDPDFELRGESLVMRGDPSGVETLVMTDHPELEADSERLQGMSLAVTPGAEPEDGSPPGAPGSDAPRAVARAGERIVVRRAPDGQTDVTFRGGFTLERGERDSRSTLTSETMHLLLARDLARDPARPDGPLVLHGWDASGRVRYVSSDTTATGNLLMYADKDEILTLTGVPARIELIDGPREPQSLAARKIRFDPRSGALRASEGVEARVRTTIGIPAGLAGRPRAPRGADSMPPPLTLKCSLAEMEFRREAGPGPADPGPARRVLVFFDATGEVSIEGNDLRGRARRATWSRDEGLLTALGTPERPAEAFLRNPDHPVEWDSLRSGRIEVHTAGERLVCPEGGVLGFYMEDLLAPRSGPAGTPAPRYPTTLACIGEISFQRGREVRFQDEVRGEQSGPDGEVRATLEADRLHARFEEAPPKGPSPEGLLIRFALAEGNVRLSHPRIVADADRLEVTPASQTVALEGRRRPARVRTARGTDISTFLRYNYRTGELESGRFTGEVAPRGRKTP